MLLLYMLLQYKMIPVIIANHQLQKLQQLGNFVTMFVYMLQEFIAHFTMEWLFGHRMTPDEMLRKNQRALNKAMRDLDRERLKMEQQEKKVIADIKKLAKDGQMVKQSYLL